MFPGKSLVVVLALLFTGNSLTMDGFNDSFGATTEADPAAEFLAREQNNLAGLEDDINPVVTNGISGGEAELSRSPSPSPVPVQHQVPREEPEKIKRWREEQKKRLEQKDEEEEAKKGEMKEAARKELDEWYKNHDEQVANNRKANRSAEKELVADTDPIEPGTEWERIAKLCDFNPKGSKHSKDISRMRSIILQVKQTPPVAKPRQ